MMTRRSKMLQQLELPIARAWGRSVNHLTSRVLIFYESNKQADLDIFEVHRSAIKIKCQPIIKEQTVVHD